MNNDLKQFSEERLKELASTPEKYDHRYTCNMLNGDESRALARIALSAKQAKPVAVLYKTGDVLTREECADDKVFAICCKVETPLYTTPQPAHTEVNSPEIPDGWLAIPATPSQAHLNSIAMRYRHDFYLLNEAQKQSALATARQMYEECSGQGYFNIAAPKPESE